MFDQASGLVCLTVQLHRHANNVRFHNFFLRYINICNIQLHLQMYITILEQSQSWTLALSIVGHNNADNCTVF